MIKAHSMSNHSYRDSVAVFKLLTRDSGFFPNRYSFVFAFGACGNGLCVREGEQVFLHAVKVGLDCNVFVVNALIGMFGKWGDVEDARKVFDLAVGCFMEALDLFHKMLQSEVKPNEYTMVSTLAACSKLVALDQGNWIHVYIRRGEIKMNDRLLASLIDMYAKCGEIESASSVFCEHKVKRKVWPWNAMIGGFAMHGKPEEAINVF
ncbi:pentatricopeptide repeat-containing protein At2g02980, chloroplastic [Medicago truncatula]|uniref:pentatricopeptide repeat-containing protein At2g02980, chloroplastic n=1 Tax=Medicago truncatula TaxID=3880 RepID=UPI0019672013|nr:pentatricopeptide repeat-containing protein At2g02980, chloroplastic-like [Medicago truncatula]